MEQKLAALGARPDNFATSITVSTANSSHRRDGLSRRWSGASQRCGELFSRVSRATAASEMSGFEADLHAGGNEVEVTRLLSRPVAVCLGLLIAFWLGLYAHVLRDLADLW